jgi:heme A synthase
MACAPVLVFAQIVLGILTVLTLRGVPLAVAHFAGAAGLWALWTSAWFMTAERKLRAVPAQLPEARAIHTSDRVLAS